MVLRQVVYFMWNAWNTVLGCVMIRREKIKGTDKEIYKENVRRNTAGFRKDMNVGHHIQNSSQASSVLWTLISLSLSLRVKRRKLVAGYFHPPCRYEICTLIACYWNVTLNLSSSYRMSVFVYICLRKQAERFWDNSGSFRKGDRQIWHVEWDSCRLIYIFKFKPAVWWSDIFFLEWAALKA